MKPELLHKGSVKDIYRLTEQELIFSFSNRYSIFDWGEMPDAIPGKGDALAQMGCKLLAHLNAKGFATHFLGATDTPGGMRVRSVDVPRDDITVYQREPKNVLIPLEVIYRLGAPKGSSLLRRFKTEGEWKAAGYDRAYREGEIFSEVKIDFTTKLERLDRVLTDLEAQRLAGMSDAEFLELKKKTLQIVAEMKSVFAQFGAQLWDGKFEFGFDENRNIILVDSIGLDEMRLTYGGNPLSKELLRQHYLDSSWYSALTRAKMLQPTEFKEYCKNILKEEPAPLPSAIVNATSVLYQTVADLILCKAEDREALRSKLQGALVFLVGKT